MDSWKGISSQHSLRSVDRWHSPRQCLRTFPQICLRFLVKRLSRLECSVRMEVEYDDHFYWRILDFGLGTYAFYTA